MLGSLNVSLCCHDTIQQVSDASRTRSHPQGISKGNFLEMTKHFTGGRFFSPSFHKAQGHIITAQCITTVFHSSVFLSSGLQPLNLACQVLLLNYA